MPELQKISMGKSLALIGDQLPVDIFAHCRLPRPIRGQHGSTYRAQQA